jgi:predicted Zn-dependent protease
MVTVIILVFVWSCAYQPGSFRDPGGDFNFISQGMEIQMGLDAAQQVDSQERIITDSQVQYYINNLGQKLVQYSRRPDIAYQFKVIDTDTVNAFALPGGFIYINRGLIVEAENEAELAGVLGHEIGHVAAKHGAKRMSKLILLQLGFTAFWALSDRDRDTRIKLLIADALATGYLLKNSRDYERQADDFGTETLYRAGYDPVAMAHFFEKLGHKHSPSAVATFFSTHPNPGERVTNVQALVATFPPKSYVTDTPEFQQIKQLLSTKNASSSGTRTNRQRQSLPQKAIGAPRRR